MMEDPDAPPATKRLKGPADASEQPTGPGKGPGPGRGAVAPAGGRAPLQPLQVAGGHEEGGRGGGGGAGAQQAAAASHPMVPPPPDECIWEDGHLSLLPLPYKWADGAGAGPGAAGAGGGAAAAGGSESGAPARFDALCQRLAEAATRAADAGSDHAVEAGAARSDASTAAGRSSNNTHFTHAHRMWLLHWVEKLQLWQYHGNRRTGARPQTTPPPASARAPTC